MNQETNKSIDLFSAMGDSNLLRKIAGIRCWLLDMDGTVSLGDDALPGSERFFQALDDADFIFLTNNSSRSAEYYVKRLQRLGFDVDRNRMLTSTDALILYLKDQLANKDQIRIFPVGTPEFEQSLRQAGLRIVKQREQVIDYVVVGFDTSLTYEKLDIACDYIRSGIPWAAANPDLVCPLPGGRVLPDCGSITALLQACTGTDPEIVIGKPETAMVDMVIKSRGLGSSELAMVGDRLYTDLELAYRAGILGVAVLSGETSLLEISEAKNKPDLVLDDIGQLADLIIAARNE